MLRLGLKTIINWLTRLAIAKHQPYIIAIAGEGANGLAREYIFQVINIQYPAVQNAESPEAEFSIPLTILGAQGYPDNNWQWLKIIVKSILQLLTVKSYHHYMVLEIDTIDRVTSVYWLKVLNPDLVVYSDQTTNFNLAQTDSIRISDVAMNEGEHKSELEGQHRQNSSDQEGEVVRRYTVADYQQLAMQIGEKFHIDPQIGRVILDSIQLSGNRIKIYQPQPHLTVLDATYHFYPKGLTAVLEMCEPHQRTLIVNPSADDLEVVSDYRENLMADHGIEAHQVNDFDIVVLRGYAPIVRRKYHWLVN